MERKGRQVQIDVYNTNQQIERDSQIERRRRRQLKIDRCIQHRTIDRQIDTQIDRRRRQVQIDVYNTIQQIDRELVRWRGRGGRYRQMYTTQNNRQIERQLDREEEGQLQIDRYIKHRTIDRQSRVYSIEQQIDRVIVGQRGRGGRYRQMYTTQNNRQIE